MLSRQMTSLRFSIACNLFTINWLWLVDFNPFCFFLFFKYRCLFALYRKEQQVFQHNKNNSVLNKRDLIITLFPRLSGESPFLGESEADTFSRITEARWEFSDVFDYVSKEAKDFINSLLLKDPKYFLHFCHYNLQLTDRTMMHFCLLIDASSNNLAIHLKISHNNCRKMST